MARMILIRGRIDTHEQMIDFIDKASEPTLTGYQFLGGPVVMPDGELVQAMVYESIAELTARNAGPVAAMARIQIDEMFAAINRLPKPATDDPKEEK